MRQLNCTTPFITVSTIAITTPTTTSDFIHKSFLAWSLKAIKHGKQVFGHTIKFNMKSDAGQ